MKLFRDMFILAAAVVVCFSVIAFNVGAFLANGPADEESFSYLEARSLTDFPNATPESMLSGEFQNALDGFLADHIPARNETVLANAALQRASIALSAACLGFDVYPTFFGSQYYAIPNDGILSGRAEEAPADGGGPVLDAWVNTLNEAARNHPDVNFVYDCVVRHDQCEWNPTYRYYDNRLNVSWVEEHMISRLDPHIDAFIDAVQSYDEVKTEWFPNDGHWTLKRALDSHNRIAERLDLPQYAYENPVKVCDAWYGDYARSGSDLDVASTLYDLPLDFSHVTFYNLDDLFGWEKTMGMRDSVLAGEAELPSHGFSMYYEYHGGAGAEAWNAGENNGKTLLFVGDSLVYCLERYLAADYQHAVFLLPGNATYEESLETYIQRYNPDDVIILTHASKYQTIADYSPAFVGLE